MDNRQLVLDWTTECDMSWTVCTRMNAYIGVFRGVVKAVLVPRTPAHGHLSYPRKGESPALFIHRLPPCVPLTRFSVHFSVEEHTLSWLQLPSPS